MHATLVCTSVALVLLLLELAFRTAYSLPPGYRQVFKDADLQRAGEPDLIFSNRPRKGPDPVCGQGFRGDCPSRERERCTYRIGFVGDSVTYGIGVSWHDAYPFKVGEMLEQSLGRRVEVINAATPGFDMVQSTAMYIHRLSAYSVDALVYGCFSNDLETQRAVFVGRTVVGVVPYYSVMPGEVWLPLGLHEFLSRSSYLYDWINFRLMRLMAADPKTLPDKFDDLTRRRSVQALRKLAHAASRQGVALVVALLPVVVRRHEDPGICKDPGVDPEPWKSYCKYNQEVLDYVADLCERLGIRVVDLRKAYVHVPAHVSLALSPDDPNHPNELGHEILARLLAGRLETILKEKGAWQCP